MEAVGWRRPVGSACAGALLGLLVSTSSFSDLGVFVAVLGAAVLARISSTHQPSGRTAATAGAAAGAFVIFWAVALVLAILAIDAAPSAFFND